MTKNPRPPAKKPWLAIIAATVVVTCLIGTSVLFASSEGATAIAEDAAVQVRVQEMIGAISISRAILSEALIFSVAYQDDKVSEATFHGVLDEANVLLEDLDAQRSALSDVLSDAAVTQALTSYSDAGSILLADLGAGRLEGTQRSDSELRAAYDRAIGLLVAERDERERHIVAVRTGVGDVANAARFVVAFFVPALAILVALAFLRRRQQRLRLEDDIDHEERVRAAKDEFLSAIAHELRTPLTAVVGFAETLRDRSRELSPKDRDELVDILADQASDTAFIVEDLLVFARANIGDLTIRDGVVQIRDLIEKEAMTWAGRYKGRLTINGDGAVWADPLRMKQVIRNLLSNALEHGGPNVEVRISPDGSNMKIQVADDGPGIPSELRSLVFEPYQHGLRTKGQTAPIGLGLTVATSLVRLMEGNLTYHYRGGNSVFEVTIPAATQERGQHPDGKARQSPARLGPSASQIMEAMEQKQFEIVYQPIVDLLQPAGDRRVVGFEALARFPSGSPPEWFAAAWGTGIGVELELDAIRRAVDGFKKAPHRAFLALNTSMETLTSPRVFEALAGISPSRIVLELSEDTVIDNYPRAKVYLDRLSRQGYRLAFDDLTPGKIDLWYLVRLRPNIVKFDISLVRDIDLEPGKRALINGLKWLGEILNSRIIAEGIERPEELEALTRLGVHYGQGYLLGRPGPIGGPLDPDVGGAVPIAAISGTV